MALKESYMPGTISIEQALIYTMVTMSGVEGKINIAVACGRRVDACLIGQVARKHVGLGLAANDQTSSAARHRHHRRAS